MNDLLKKISLLAGALALAGCSSSPEPPADYTLDQSSLPAVNELVDLGEEFQFNQSTDEDGALSYAYSGLSSGMQTARDYTQALEDSWTCRIMADTQTGADAEFTSTAGQAVAVCETSDPQQEFVLTIQWTENSCTVSPALMQTSDVAAPAPDTTSVTLEQAVDALKAQSPQQLGLSGESMEDYLIFAQDGTAMLDDQPCVCVNVYLAQTHKFEQSYLLTLPDLTIYRLDRASGQAEAVG